MLPGEQTLARHRGRPRGQGDRKRRAPGSQSQPFPHPYSTPPESPPLPPSDNHTQEVVRLDNGSQPGSQKASHPLEGDRRPGKGPSTKTTLDLLRCETGRNGRGKAEPEERTGKEVAGRCSLPAQAGVSPATCLLPPDASWWPSVTWLCACLCAFVWQTGEGRWNGNGTGHSEMSD